MKLIDLHLHLDGSLSLQNIKELAALQGTKLNLTDAELLQKLRAGKDCRNLNDFLEKFDFPLTFLQTKETISHAVYRLQEELITQGIIYAEIRFAPQLHTRQSLTQKQVVEAAIEGLNRSALKCNLILCCMRGDNNKAENIETVNTAAEYLGKGVCAIDLAGAEALYPTKDFEYIFTLANEKGVPFTIHAGEADGAESVKTALNFGAKRIGHGIRAVEDEEILKRLADGKIPLELCPTSNIVTCIYPDINSYPIKKLLDYGITVTINTDDMMVIGITEKEEITTLAETFSLTKNDVKNLVLNSVNAAFTDDVTKAELKGIIEEDFNKFS